MKKTYVLDTNILLENPDCLIESFDDNDLIIPLTVIEELDNLKNSPGDTGYCSRQALRNIEKLRDGQNISKGVKRNEQGAMLSIITITPEEKIKYNEMGFKADKPDDAIILTAMKAMDKIKDMPVILISNDTSVRIKGSLLDIPTEFYKEGSVPRKTLEFTGFRNVHLPLDFFGEVENGKFVSKRTPQKLSVENIQSIKEIDPPIANEFLLISPEESDDILSKKERKKLKTVYRYTEGELIKKNLLQKNVYGGLSGKNLEQSVALDVLLDDSVKVVALSGPSGAGKTILAISSCLTKILKEPQLGYEKLILLKPTVSVSDEIGFLPGNVEEKLSKYMGSYMDNFKTLRKMDSVYTRSSSSEDTFEKLKEKGIIEIESISFLRGRSLSDCLIIADEVQNVTQTVIKTILTRVGENCKIILLGDTSQIDRPYLSKYNNGLSYAIDRLMGQEFFAHVKFVQGVRSIVSKVSAELL